MCVDVFLITESIFLPGDGQTQPVGQIHPVTYIFCMTYELRMICNFLKGWGKVKKIFHDPGKLYETQISVSVNSFLNTQPHFDVYVLSMAYLP